MNKNQGDRCGLCGNQVPEHVAYCSGCGAAKGTRAETLMPGAALMRFGIWSNTLGLILFLTIYMAFQPWFDESIRQGTQKVCRTEIKVKKPVAYEFLKDEKKSVYQLATEACEDLSNLDQLKAGLLAAAHRAEPAGSVITPGKTFSTRETLRTPPTWFNWAEVIARSFGALVVGGFLLGLARKIWTKIFGRLSDPMWIPKK